MTAAGWMPLINELKSAVAARNRAAARRCVQRLLDGQAPLGTQWRSVCEFMRVSGEISLALRSMDAYVAAMGHAPQALYSKVVLLTQCARMSEALQLIERLPADIPDRAGHAYVRGNVAMSLGRFAEARDWLEQAVALRPGWGPAWLTLVSGVNLATDTLGERLLADADAARRQAGGDYARYCYALGKLHADRGAADAAFDAFAQGAQLLRRELPYSRSGNAANATQAMSGYSAERLEHWGAGRRRDTHRPIFVTGLPRSGTTLVEQILASHSGVAEGAELNIMQHLAVQAGGVSGDALSAYEAGGGSADALAELYLHLLDERCGSSGRIVDKTVDASRFLGLVAAALPHAPIIWMQRDPLDNAWSCFRTFFIHGVAWSYDLADIAHHFHLEEQLLAHWRRALGPRLLVVPYGELVDDPTTWTSRLLAHCGLPEEDAPYRPHATERRVMTASAHQVRRPINRDGLGVADRFRHRLQPFIDGTRDSTT